MNSDGIADIFSGCYSSTEPDEGMAGEFHVLLGKKGGGFEKAKTVDDAEGNSLKLAAIDGGSDPVIDMICTRPWAVDLDGDGNLDIVSGNFAGTFAVFWGQDEGGFDPVSSPLTDTKGKALRVSHHSDPSFIDWDGDGDMDMLSGSDNGGVALFPNVGSKTEPSFGKSIQLVKEAGGFQMNQKIVFGDEHIKAPGRSTRAVAADMNGDGKLDLVIGDSTMVVTPAEGLSEEDVQKKLAEWEAGMEELTSDMPEWSEEMSEEQQKAFDTFQQKMMAHYEAKAKIVDERSTGFVWVLYQK